MSLLCGRSVFSCRKYQDYEMAVYKVKWVFSWFSDPTSVFEIAPHGCHQPGDQDSNEELSSNRFQNGKGLCSSLSCGQVSAS